MSLRALGGIASRLIRVRRINERADLIFESLRADLRVYPCEAEDGSRLWDLATDVATLLIDDQLQRTPTHDEAVAKLRGALASQLAASRTVGQAIGDVRDHLTDLFPKQS